MSTYFTFNNIKSSEFGLIIEDRILYPSSLTNSEGVININVCYINKNGTESHLRCFRDIQKWLNNTGELTTNEYNDGYYKVNGTEVNITERLLDGIRFNIKFSVEQYRYLNSQKLFTPITLTDETEHDIYNEGDNIAYPIFNIESIGDITLNINNKELIIKDTNGYFTLDSELQDCYNTTKLLNNNLIGEFPYLEVGHNVLILTGDIKNISIKVNSTTY